MRRNLSLQIYSWNVNGLNASEDNRLQKRKEIKGMFKEARDLLKHNTTQIVFIALTAIDVKDYSELSFRLNEFDLNKEIDHYGFDYFWAPAQSHLGGVILFWKSIDSTQILISDKVMTTSSASEMTFAECSVISKSLDSEVKFLVSAVLCDDDLKFQEQFQGEVKNDQFDFIVIAGSHKQKQTKSFSHTEFNEMLKPWSDSNPLKSPNALYQPTSTYSQQPQDFIYSNASQRGFSINMIGSYQVCEKSGEQTKQCTLKAKLYEGHYPLESTIKFPTDFRIAVENKQEVEEKEISSSERKKYQLYIEKLEVEIERLRAEAHRRNQVIKALQHHELENKELSQQLKKSQEQVKDLLSKFQESSVEVQRLKQLDFSMSKEEIYTQTSVEESPLITDRDSVKELPETEEYEALKAVTEILEIKNESLLQENSTMKQRLEAIRKEIEELNERVRHQQSKINLQSIELNCLRRRSRVGRTLVKFNWLRYIF